MTDRGPRFPQLDRLREETIPDVFEEKRDFRHKTGRGVRWNTVREKPMDEVYKDE